MNLPKTWSLVALGDIAAHEKGAIRRGPFGGSLKKEIFVESGFKVYEQQNAIKDDFQIGNYFIDEDKFREMEGFNVKPHDLIISCAGTIGKVAIVPYEALPGVINQALMRIRPNPEIILCRYLKWLLESPKYQRDIFGKSAGSALKNLAAISEIKKCKIPLPPLEEQRRIAAILDKADGVRRKRKEAIRLTEELLRSTFLEMFGDPVTNPKGWEIGKVIDYADCIVPGRDKPKSFTGDIPWVTTTDLNHLGYTYKSRLNIGLTIDEIKQVNARIIPKDSVLLTCAGDLGVTSIAGCNMVVNQQLHSFQCNEIDNHFLMHVITYQKNFMHQRATQTTVPYMNKTACNSIPVIYPPLELQRKFGGFCRKFSASTSQFDSLEQSENLFNSLLQRAFRGEL